MERGATNYSQADIDDYLRSEKAHAAEVFELGTSSVRFMNLGGTTVGAWVEKDAAGSVISEVIKLRPK